jgi:hypothetical protein
LEIKYRYRVFLKRDPVSKPITTSKAITFFLPVTKGEKVILASHLKKLRGMPDWVRGINAWLVEDIVHIAEKSDGLLKEGAILVLIPSTLPY